MEDTSPPRRTRRPDPAVPAAPGVPLPEDNDTPEVTGDRPDDPPGGEDDQVRVGADLSPAAETEPVKEAVDVSGINTVPADNSGLTEDQGTGPFVAPFSLNGNVIVDNSQRTVAIVGGNHMTREDRVKAAEWLLGKLSA